MNQLDGKVILVTGASDGFGQVLALNLLDQGARVVLHGRSLEKLRNLTDDFDDLDDWLIVSGDIADESDCKHLVELCIQKFGRLDALVNNSVIVLKECISQGSLSEFDQLLSMNLHAIGVLSELCYPYLAKTNGQILNVNMLTTFYQFLQHPNANIIKHAYEQFNRHCTKLYSDKISIKLLDPWGSFEEVQYLSDFCFTYKQQLNQWAKANRCLEESGQLDALAIKASMMLEK